MTGPTQTIVLQPNVLYADNTADDYNDDLSYFGVEFDPQYTDRLVIRRGFCRIRWPFRAGLRDGDEITTWHGERIRSPRQFAQVIHDEKPGRVDFGYFAVRRRCAATLNFDRREESRTALKPVPTPARQHRGPRTDSDRSTGTRRQSSPIQRRRQPAASQSRRSLLLPAANRARR